MADSLSVPRLPNGERPFGKSFVQIRDRVFSLPTSTLMTDAVINRLAQRLLKCPFDDELFDSVAGLELHLFEGHGDKMCEKRRVPRPVSEERAERPIRLNICRYCQDEGRYFAIPHFIDQAATDDIIAHIEEHHRPASGHPPFNSFRNTDNADEIDRFMAEQRLKDEFVCLSPECGERCDDVASMVGHWLSEHVENPTPEDVRRALEADPQGFCDRFADEIEAAFDEIQAEEVRSRRTQYAADDGYRIRHMPPVPRIRSRPGEFIVYVEGRLTRLPDDAVKDIIESEGGDGSEMTGGDWADGRQQVAKLELRFCNIVDGYIPLVEEVRRILPSIEESAIIQVSWQDKPDAYFPCKVSTEKHAVYNLDGKLKRMFGLHSGAWLYITRVGPLRYQLSVRKAPHWVRNCKIFKGDGKGGWQIEFRDEWVEWETGDDVFRHQITFEEMEALHAEARHTNLSVREAVHKVMKRDAATQPLSVRAVWDIVFPFRTCSLAAVWAQFRPEHECYRRVEAGTYIFDPSGAFPEVRIRPRTGRIEQATIEHDGIGRADSTRLRIVVHWSRIFKEPCPDEEFKADSSGVLYARFLGSLLARRPEITERLTRENVSRFPLSSAPETCFKNSQNNRPYPKRPVPGTQPQLYLCTQGGTYEMRHHILSLAERLHFPQGSVEVAITPGWQAIWRYL